MSRREGDLSLSVLGRGRESVDQARASQSGPDSDARLVRVEFESHWVAGTCSRWNSPVPSKMRMRSGRSLIKRTEQGEVNRITKQISALNTRSSSRLASRVHLAYGRGPAMLAPGAQRNSRHPATGAICALLTLAALVFVVTSAAPKHIHETSTAGFYNAECPLAELGARQGLASLPSVPPSVWLGLVRAEGLLVGPDHVSAVVVLSADSRAPPLA